MSHQDWKPVTFDKYKPPPKKPTISINKVDKEEIGCIKRVGTALGKQIQQARLQKKMSQAQLANLINIKKQLMQQYENGKAKHDPNILQKLRKTLGVKLSK